MKSLLLYLLIVFWVSFIANAAVSPEIYWKVKLPNTQIPKVIKDCLPYAASEEKQEGTRKEVFYGSPEQWGVWPRFYATASNKLDMLKGYQAYFLEKDVVKGKVITFPSLKNNNKAPFWPRHFVESIPFSSKEIPEILNHLSINTTSKEAKTIEQTTKVCEQPQRKEEKTMCATSLESMVDASLSLLGTNNMKALTTLVVDGKTRQPLQKYSIEDVQEEADGDTMICHKLNYAYAVHYCHIGGGAKTFTVSMIGGDGVKVKALLVCHKDTSFWNPKALPFVELKVKPGAIPICHFLQDDHIVFVPSKPSN